MKTTEQYDYRTYKIVNKKVCSKIIKTTSSIRKSQKSEMPDLKKEIFRQRIWSTSYENWGKK